MAEENYQLYISRIPKENRYMLQRKLDFQHGGVEKHLNKIADAFVNWNENLADLMGLTRIERDDILTVYANRPILQRRSALRRWKDKNGLNATYEKILKICLNGESNDDCANVIVELLGGSPKKDSPEAQTGNLGRESSLLKEVKEFSKDLSADELAQWLESKGVPKKDCEQLRDAGISGRLFMNLTKERLEDYGVKISPVGFDTIKELQKEMNPTPGEQVILPTGTNSEAKTSPDSSQAQHETDSASVAQAKSDWPQGNCVESDGGKLTEYEATNRGSFIPRLKLHDEEDKLTVMKPEPTGPYNDPNNLGFYPMESKKHGVAWIINNKIFQKHKTRYGTDRDEDNLVETLRFLGYRIKIFRNLKKQETLDLFTAIDKHLSESNTKAQNKVANDSFICCILSHGDKGQIISSDNEFIEIEVIERLTADSKMLEWKPKIFFIQACQGKKSTRLINRIQADGEVQTSKRAHFYLCYATVAGDRAYRDIITGSWFVIEVCKLLCEKGTCMSLHSDFQPLVNRVANNPAYTFHGFVEQPTCSNQLHHHVHFFNT